MWSDGAKEQLYEGVRRHPQSELETLTGSHVTVAPGWRTNPDGVHY